MKTHVAKLFLLLLAGMSLVACNNNKTNPTPAPTKLATPYNLQITGTTLTWTSVPNANRYRVGIIGGMEYDAATNTYSLPNLTPGDYQIRVRAMSGVGTNFTDSDWSNLITHTVDAPDVLYELPGDLEINIGIIDEAGSELGVITKAVLAFIGQEEVTDPENAARHFVAYSMTEIFTHLGISADFDSAFLEASDNPVAYNTTVVSFDNAYLAVVRMTTATGEVQTTSNFPRFLAGNGYVEGQRILGNVGTITLDGSAPPQPPPPSPPPLLDVPYDLPETLVINIEIFCDMGIQQGVITKAILDSIAQVEVPDPAPQNPTLHYVAYPLTEILDLMEISGNFVSVIGEAADGFYVVGTIDDAYIAVVRRHANGDVESVSNFPRFLVPSGEGFRAGETTPRPGMVSGVIKIILGQ